MQTQRCSRPCRSCTDHRSSESPITQFRRGGSTVALPLTIDTHAHYFPESYLKLDRRSRPALRHDGDHRRLGRAVHPGRARCCAPARSRSQFYRSRRPPEDDGPHGRAHARAVADAADGVLGRRRAGARAVRRLQRRRDRGAPQASRPLHRLRLPAAAELAASRWRSSSARRSCPGIRGALHGDGGARPRALRPQLLSRSTSAPPTSGCRSSCTR